MHSVNMSRPGYLTAAAFICFFSIPLAAQTSDDKAAPVIVQPGAPGQATRVLPPSTHAQLPPRSPKDVDFMQGMITHHLQAVEMSALIEARTQNKEIRLLGARISQSQSDEMSFMKRWLEARGEPVAAAMSQTGPSTHAGTTHMVHTAPLDKPGHMLMPGMLTPQQIEALSRATGAAFDRLFLAGMIQHHNGALVMVKELFDTGGAGQDAEVFNFATDVDSGQRAEIKRMETLLGIKT